MTSPSAQGTVRPARCGPSERTKTSTIDMARSRTIIPPFGVRQRWFVHSVATVNDHEMDCTTALDMLSRLAETHPHSAVDDASLNDVYVHLEHCRHCTDVFHTLLELVDMEETGSLPEVDPLLQQVQRVTSPAVP